MDLLLLLLLLVAVAAGFVAGVWQGQKRAGRWWLHFLPQPKKYQYLTGLKQLLNDEPDAAIETFTRHFDVNSQTLDTHLALGTLLRKRGEVDKAIQVHQNILQTAELAAEDTELAQMELALDYKKAGLLDRAELMFKPLAESADIDIKKKALENLVSIYEQEQEWQQAMVTAGLLNQRKLKVDKTRWSELQAHYLCEQAVSAAGRNDSAESKQWVNKALAVSPKHPRATLMMSQILLEENRPQNAMTLLMPLTNFGVALFEAIPPFKAACARLDAWQTYQQALLEVYEQQKTAALVPLIAECMALEQGQKQALAFLAEELQKHPQFAAAVTVICSAPTGVIPFNTIMQAAFDALEPRIVCDSCGFESAHFYWQCPTCKHWH